MTKRGAAMKANTLPRALLVKRTIQRPILPPKREEGLTDGLEGVVDPAAGGLRHILLVPVADNRRVGLRLLPQLVETAQDLGGLLDTGCARPRSRKAIRGGSGGRRPSRPPGGASCARAATGSVRSRRRTGGRSM